MAEVTTTEYVDGVPHKTVAKFRAYDSYAESFRDFASLIGNSPRYAQARQQTGSVQGCADGPAGRRLRHRPGLRGQAQPRHQHHAAAAACL